MSLRCFVSALCVPFVMVAGPAAALETDAPVECSRCAEWNTAHAPFRIHGNTYYVGTRGLSAVLVTGEQGAILIDGALPQSAPQIARNVESLGFRVEDVQWILSSHAHFDHAGGVAALARASGARVGATPAGAAALRAGSLPQDDPQYDPKDEHAFPAVADAQGLADGTVVRVGDVAVTLRASPGHAPGGASYTWRSCDGDDCVDVVYADSLNAVSAEGFEFGADPARVAAFRATLARIEKLPCDVLLTVHPEFADTFAKAARAADAGPGAANPFVETGACARYAQAARTRLDERLAHENAAP